MSFSISLSVGEVHFTLTPVPHSPSSSSPSSSCTVSDFESSIVSIKHRHRHKEGKESSKKAETSENDLDDHTHDSDNNDDTGEGFDGEDDELIADLSNFSGTLCISKGKKVGTRKNILLKKTDTGPSNANEADDHSSDSHGRASVSNDKKIGAAKSIVANNVDSDSLNDTEEKKLQSSNHEEVIRNEDTNLNVCDTSTDAGSNFERRRSSLDYFYDNSCTTNRREMERTPLDEAKRDENSIEGEDYVDDLQLQQDKDLATAVDMCNLQERRNAAIVSFRMSSSINLGETTMLHAACASNKSNILTLRSILQSNPSFASAQDSFGRLPIHIFAQNEAFASSLSRNAAVGSDSIRTSNESAELFLGELFDAAPRSVMVPDVEGNIPFVSAIVEWTKLVHLEAHRQMSPLNVRYARSSGINVDDVFASYSMDEQRRIFFFPKGVKTTTFVAWSLQMLSLLLEKCHEKRDCDTYALIRDVIIKEVSSVPLFCKTVLLIESNSEFQKTRSLSIVKSSFFNKNAVGVWLVAMFKGPKLAQNRVVDFLQQISSMAIYDMIGDKYDIDNSWQCSQSDIDHFINTKQETFEAVANLPSIIPTLRVLPSKGLERAATTKVVHYMLNKRIGKPWALYSMLLDGVMSLILIASFKLATEVTPFIDDVASYGRDPYDPFFLIYIISFYFIHHEVMTIVSIGSSSKKLMLHYFRDVWVLADLVALAMVIFTTIMVHERGEEYTGTLALTVTVALLWVKIIGFLKALNMELATFILAITEIIKDMKWFALVLVVAIIMFSEMVEIILKYTPGLCSDSSGETIEFFCSRHPLESYVRIYSIVIGDFSLDDFTQTPLVTAMFVLFTFFGIIVLLSILVAIATDSYAKSMLRSYGLFGKARVEYVLRQVAREAITAPKLRLREDRSSMLSATMILKWLLPWCSFLMVASITGAVGYYIVSILVTSNILSGISGVNFYYGSFTLLMILYSSSIFAVIVSVVGALFFDISWLTEKKGKSVMRLVFDLVRLPILLLCMILGIKNHEDEIKDTELAESDDWLGQINFFSQRTEGFVNKSEERLKVEVKVQVSESEKRQMKHVECLKNELQNEMRTLIVDEDG